MLTGSVTSLYLSGLHRKVASIQTKKGGADRIKTSGRQGESNAGEMDRYFSLRQELPMHSGLGASLSCWGPPSLNISSGCRRTYPVSSGKDPIPEWCFPIGSTRGLVLIGMESEPERILGSLRRIRTHCLSPDPAANPCFYESIHDCSIPERSIGTFRIPVCPLQEHSGKFQQPLNGSRTKDRAGVRLFLRKRR